MGNKISQYNIPVEDTVVQEGGTCSFRSRYLDDINGPFDFTSGFTDLKTALIQSFTMNKDKLSVGAVINTQPKETDCDSSGMKENVLEYEYITYGELHQKVHQLAKSLHSLELWVLNPEHGLKICGIYLENRPDWSIMDCACIFANITTVPFYRALSSSGIAYMIGLTRMETLLWGKDQVEKVIEVIQFEESQVLKNLILCDEVSEEILQKLDVANIKVYFLNTLIESGKDLEVELENPTADSIFTINGTSGTTGNPKGVPSNHRSFIFDFYNIYNVELKRKDYTSYLSYMPLAHLFERIYCLFSLVKGAKIGYYSGDMTKLTQAMMAVKPNYVIMMPRIFARLYDVMMNIVSEDSYLLATLQKWNQNPEEEIFTDKENYIHELYDHPIVEKWRNMFGGNLKVVCTGGAPNAPEVIKFFRVILSGSILEKFGQTESGVVLSNDPMDIEQGHVGGIGPTIEFKLVDVPDMNYTSKDVIDGVSIPRGELCLRDLVLNAQIFTGYFLEPEKTKEVIDEDGWFHTGDIVSLLPNYAVRIIDRKKNIFKLSQGEYIVPDKLELEYSKIDIVRQIFVYGDPTQNYIVAVVVPEQSEVERWAINNSVNIDTVYESEELAKHLKKLFQQKKLENGFNSLEVPQRFIFTHEEMTPDNNVLTPTMKVKRHNAKLKYLELIREMYDGAILQGE